MAKISSQEYAQLLNAIIPYNVEVPSSLRPIKMPKHHLFGDIPSKHEVSSVFSKLLLPPISVFGLPKGQKDQLYFANEFILTAIYFTCMAISARMKAQIASVIGEIENLSPDKESALVESMNLELRLLTATKSVLNTSDDLRGALEVGDRMKPLLEKYNSLHNLGDLIGNNVETVIQRFRENNDITDAKGELDSNIKEFKVQLDKISKAINNNMLEFSSFFMSSFRRDKFVEYQTFLRDLTFKISGVSVMAMAYLVDSDSFESTLMVLEHLNQALFEIASRAMGIFWFRLDPNAELSTIIQNIKTFEGIIQTLEGLVCNAFPNMHPIFENVLSDIPQLKAIIDIIYDASKFKKDQLIPISRQALTALPAIMSANSLFEKIICNYADPSSVDADVNYIKNVYNVISPTISRTLNIRLQNCLQLIDTSLKEYKDNPEDIYKRFTVGLNAAETARRFCDAGNDQTTLPQLIILSQNFERSAVEYIPIFISSIEKEYDSIRQKLPAGDPTFDIIMGCLRNALSIASTASSYPQINYLAIYIDALVQLYEGNPVVEQLSVICSLLKRTLYSYKMILKSGIIHGLISYIDVFCIFCRSIEIDMNDMLGTAKTLRELCVKMVPLKTFNVWKLLEISRTYSEFLLETQLRMVGLVTNKNLSKAIVNVARASGTVYEEIQALFASLGSYEPKIDEYTSKVAGFVITNLITKIEAQLEAISSNLKNEEEGLVHSAILADITNDMTLCISIAPGLESLASVLMNQTDTFLEVGYGRNKSVSFDVLIKNIRNTLDNLRMQSIVLVQSALIDYTTDERVFFNGSPVLVKDPVQTIPNMSQFFEPEAECALHLEEEEQQEPEIIKEEVVNIRAEEEQKVEDEAQQEVIETEMEQEEHAEETEKSEPTPTSTEEGIGQPAPIQIETEITTEPNQSESVTEEPEQTLEEEEEHITTEVEQELISTEQEQEQSESVPAENEEPEQEQEQSESVPAENVEPEQEILPAEQEQQELVPEEKEHIPTEPEQETIPTEQEQPEPVSEVPSKEEEPCQPPPPPAVVVVEEEEDIIDEYDDGEVFDEEEEVHVAQINEQPNESGSSPQTTSAPILQRRRSVVADVRILPPVESWEIVDLSMAYTRDKLQSMARSAANPLSQALIAQYPKILDAVAALIRSTGRKREAIIVSMKLGFATEQIISITRETMNNQERGSSYVLGLVNLMTEISSSPEFEEVGNSALLQTFEPVMSVATEIQSARQADALSELKANCAKLGRSQLLIKKFTEQKINEGRLSIGRAKNKIRKLRNLCRRSKQIITDQLAAQTALVDARRFYAAAKSFRTSVQQK